MSKARTQIAATYRKAMEDRTPRPHFATHDDKDEDMDWYVYSNSRGTRVVVATELYEDDAKFIAACYTHIGTLLKEGLDRLNSQA